MIEILQWWLNINMNSCP